MTPTRRRTGPGSLGHCRWCGVRVDMLPHVTTKKFAPIVPAPPDMAGNIAVTADGEYFVVEPGTGELINHWADCPEAPNHRKPAPTEVSA